MFVGDSETFVLLATWDFSVQSPLYISFFMLYLIEVQHNYVILYKCYGIVRYHS